MAHHTCTAAARQLRYKRKTNAYFSSELVLNASLGCLIQSVLPFNMVIVIKLVLLTSNGTGDVMQALLNEM